MGISNAVLAHEFKNTRKISKKGGLLVPFQTEVIDFWDYRKIADKNAETTLRPDNWGHYPRQIIIANDDTFNYCRITNFEETPLVLNFANPCYPGGGVLKGSIAQEEDLCRKSNLYESLVSKEAREYYYTNRISEMPFKENNAILTRRVSIFKDNEFNICSPKIVDVLTIAAPKLTEDDVNDPAEKYKLTLYQRLRMILDIAEYHQYHELVLGAFGCGVFKNKPIVVANGFRRMMSQGLYHFDKVHFVIKVTKAKDCATYSTFCDVFKNN
jgi:uncharacterized protein (TIGR02452 family)